MKSPPKKVPRITRADKESELKYRIITDLEDLKLLNPTSGLIENVLRLMQSYSVNH